MDSLINYIQDTKKQCSYLIGAYKYKSDGSYNYLEDPSFENSFLAWMRVYNELKREKDAVLLRLPIEKIPLIIRLLTGLNNDLEEKFSTLDLSKLHSKLEFKYTRFKNFSKDLNSSFLQDLGELDSDNLGVKSNEERDKQNNKSNSKSEKLNFPLFFQTRKNFEIFLHLQENYAVNRLPSEYSHIFHFMNYQIGEFSIGKKEYIEYLTEEGVGISKIQEENPKYHDKIKPRLLGLYEVFNHE